MSTNIKLDILLDTVKKSKEDVHMSNKPSLKSNNPLINAALYIVIGLLLCIFRASLLEWAMTAVGIVMIVLGVLKALQNELIEGVIMAAVGIVIILGGWLFVDIILLVLGIALAAKGVLDLIKALETKDIPPIVGSAITILVGVALVISKWALLDWLFIIIGVVLIVDGVLMALGKKS